LAVEKLGKSDIFPGVLKQKNHFVVMGATGPDYPYLTDVIKSQVLHVGHNWANRMHYENTGSFIREGTKKLSFFDKRSHQFKNCLAWLAGYVSHVIADSYLHPVVNCTVQGVYLFTHKEHGRCELVQDIYIFNKVTGTDICITAARDGRTFGYLNILDDCSDPQDLDKMHPHIKEFWTDILKSAHPNASANFDSIDPDVWHKNYKNRVDFASDSRSIFRHVLDIVNAPQYVPWEKIPQEERLKYIEEVMLPNGTVESYDKLFDQAADRIVLAWKTLFPCIQDVEIPPEAFFKDWNLDTGVDESKIDFWQEA
jgi:hypothetical protein